MRCAVNDLYEMFLVFPKRNRPLLEQCLNIAKQEYIKTYKKYVRKYYKEKNCTRIELLDYKDNIRKINEFLEAIDNPSFKKEEIEDTLKEIKRIFG